jgi:hypothetical protein
MSAMIADNQRHPVRCGEKSVELLPGQPDERGAIFRATFAHEVAVLCASLGDSATDLFVRRPQNLLGFIHPNAFPPSGQVAARSEVGRRFAD